MQPVTIDPEFKQLIPPLSQQEYEQLEANLLADGCRDPLVVWNGVLIDGHNRYEICTRHDLPFDTVAMDFSGRGEAIEWIVRNQLGRRNLLPAARVELVRHLRPVFEERAKANLVTSTGGSNPQPRLNLDKPVVPIRTDQALADLAGMGKDTFRKIETVLDSSNQKLADDLRAGGVSPDAAFKEVKKEERKIELAEARLELAEKAKAMPINQRWEIWQGDVQTWQAPQQYDFIITDPPYLKEYLPLYEVLAERANDWLKEGGLLVAMCGQSYLDQIYAMMSKHLTYYWTACYLTPKQPTPLRQVNVNTTWKPLLIFRKGEYKGKIFGDVFTSSHNDKDLHKWGQSEEGMFDVISQICLQGQSILDPFCGAGTTGVAALRHNCFFHGLELDTINVSISQGRLSEVEND